MIGSILDIIEEIEREACGMGDGTSREEFAQRLLDAVRAATAVEADPGSTAVGGTDA